MGLSKREVKIIIIGLDNSGKSTMINFMKPKKVCAKVTRALLQRCCLSSRAAACLAPAPMTTQYHSLSFSSLSSFFFPSFPFPPLAVCLS